MKNVYLYTYNNFSAGAKELANALEIKRIKREGSRFKPSNNKTIINWGNSEIPAGYQTCRILNDPLHVSTMSNKFSSFRQFSESGVRVPDYTESGAEAYSWFRKGNIVVGRSLLRASGGAGITIFDPEEITPDDFGGIANNAKVRLYVKYIPKKHEYRIHLFKDANNDTIIIDTQRKGLSSQANREEISWKVRNLANGFVFVRNDGHTPHEDVFHQARLAFDASRLDFGAVDVIFNESREEAYVLEINTAPGLIGTTIENYATAVRNII